MEPIKVMDLSIPPELVDEIAQLRKQSRLRTRESLREFDQNVRLRIHFGGQNVALVRNPGGTFVAAAGEPDEVRAALDQLPADFAKSLSIVFPEPWGMESDFFALSQADPLSR